MKNKTEAAKILLANGWTFEEVQEVLGQTPIYPYYNPQRFWWETAPTYVKPPVITTDVRPAQEIKYTFDSSQAEDYSASTFSS